MPGRWGRAAHHLSLDAPQRRILIFLLGLLIVYAGVRYAVDPVYIDAPQPIAGDRSTDLADKLDPNTADISDLAALPGIGETRAKALIAWRDKVKARDGKAVVFKSAVDLYYVKGFARSMVEQISPFLIFPAAPPTMQK